MQRDPALKTAVLDIKQGLINRNLYGMYKGRTHYHSQEIYDAVFIEGVRTAEEFLSLHAKKNINGLRSRSEPFIITAEDPSSAPLCPAAGKRAA